MKHAEMESLLDISNGRAMERAGSQLVPSQAFLGAITFFLPLLSACLPLSPF